MQLRNDMRNDPPYDSGRSGWMVPLVLLVALTLGGLIYAFSGGGSNMASSSNTPAASTTGSGTGTTGSGAGTGKTGEETGAAVTQTPEGAAMGGGGAASR